MHSIYLTLMPTITFFISHDNAKDLGIMRSYLNLYRDQGFSIFAYHYPSYSTSAGTGPILDLDSRITPAALILESPSLTAFLVVTVIPIFRIDKFRNNKKLLW